MSYNLSAILEGHTNDVRCVAAYSGDSLVSGNGVCMFPLLLILHLPLGFDISIEVTHYKADKSGHYCEERLKNLWLF